MESLISYKDWLMLTRGKIEPKVGDKLYNTQTDEYCEVDKQDLELLQDSRFEYYFQCLYVEVSYPVIEWKEEIDQFTLVGRLGIFSLFYITKYPENIQYKLTKVLKQEDFGYRVTLFKGTIEKCKQKANQLLYGITE